MTKFLPFLILIFVLPSIVHAQCTNTSAWGSGAAPTGGGTTTLSTCNYAGEYNTVTGVAASTNYRSTASVGTTYITVHQGSYNGPVIASGVQPLNWTSTSAGTYYIHYNTNAACGTASTCLTTTLVHVPATCNNGTNAGSLVAPASGSSVNGSMNASSYMTITGVAAATAYVASSSVATDYITVRQGTPGGTVIASGVQPLNWTSTVAGTYYIHINTNSSCGTSATTRTLTVTRPVPACTNTTAYGSVTAPTSGSTTTVSTCNYAGEYNTITGVAATTNYISTASVAGTYITVRQGTSNGTLITAGTTPLSWTSTVAGTYYIHYNTNSSCGTAATCLTTTIQHVLTGCTNATANGSVAAPTGGGSVTLSTTMQAGQYGTMTGATAATTYITTSSVATDFITVRFNTAGGTIVASGTSPLTWASGAAGNYFIHINTNAACGTSATNRTVSIQHVLPACTNTSGWGSGTAPVNATVTLSTCNYAGEYNTINSVAAATQYTSSVDLVNGYITIRQGTSNGPVIASGLTPLTWTSTVAGTYYQHINTNSSCGTNSVCTGSYISNSCLPTPTSASASPSSICQGVTTNISAVSPGNTIRWYTVSSGGVSIGSSASGANFAVTPTSSTTYWAESWNGSCASLGRRQVTVSVTPSPSAPASVTSTPSTICLGSSTTLSTTGGGGSNPDFTGYYAPANWSTTHAPATDFGTVNTSGAPASISLTSSNGGNTGPHSVLFTITVPTSGNITFNWSYTTNDAGGAYYDQPEYSINGVTVGVIPGFYQSCGYCADGYAPQSGTASIPVLAGQTFSLQITAYDDILGTATVVISNFAGPVLASNVNWFTSSSGGTSFATGLTPSVTPGSAGTVTYYAESFDVNGCVSTTRTPVTVNVSSASTTPTISPIAAYHCPNTNVSLSASGGTSGTNSNVYWYSGPNGTGSLLHTGANFTVAPSSTTTYYCRREGDCNTTADAQITVNVRQPIYAANGTSSSTYCTDNSGWHHFYVGADIILSIQGDLSGMSSATATIYDNGTYFVSGGTPASCPSTNPGEAKFEMARSWNLNYTGTLNGTYDVRFYHKPLEKNDVITAANNWISTYSGCNYTYKYANPNGWYWFKNTGTPYVAPQWDGTHYTTTAGTAPNGTNYCNFLGVTSFSGGTGGVILVPDLILPVELLSFTGFRNNNQNILQWNTAQEINNAGFEIERSVSADQGFEKIGFVEAKNLNNQSYQFIDPTAQTGSLFYRLKQLDQNGEYHYSQVVEIQSVNAQLFNLYPTVTQQQVTFQSLCDQSCEINILNTTGQKINSLKVKGLSKITIDLENYAPGVYILNIEYPSLQIRKQEKVVKQ